MTKKSNNRIGNVKCICRNFKNNYNEILTSFDADTALTYDAGLLLIDAIKRTNSDLISLNLFKALKQGKIDGATGTIDLSLKDNPFKKVHMLCLTNGTFKVKK